MIDKIVIEYKKSILEIYISIYFIVSKKDRNVYRETKTTFSRLRIESVNLSAPNTKRNSPLSSWYTSINFRLCICTFGRKYRKIVYVTPAESLRVLNCAHTSRSAGMSNFLPFLCITLFLLFLRNYQ